MRGRCVEDAWKMRGECVENAVFFFKFQKKPCTSQKKRYLCTLF